MWFHFRASFFPRQSALKFDIQPRINRSVSMAVRRGSPHNMLQQTRSTGLSPARQLVCPAHARRHARFCDMKTWYAVQDTLRGGEGASHLQVCTVQSMPFPTKAGWLNKEYVGRCST